MNKFTYAECFRIDPEGKNVLFIYYPENIDSERLENLGDNIRENLDRWAKEPDSPIYVLCLPQGVRVKIGKIAKSETEPPETLREQWAKWLD